MITNQLINRRFPYLWYICTASTPPPTKQSFPLCCDQHPIPAPATWGDDDPCPSGGAKWTHHTSDGSTGHTSTPVPPSTRTLIDCGMGRARAESRPSDKQPAQWRHYYSSQANNKSSQETSHCRVARDLHAHWFQHYAAGDMGYMRLLCGYLVGILSQNERRPGQNGVPLLWERIMNIYGRVNVA